MGEPCAVLRQGSGGDAVIFDAIVCVGFLISNAIMFLCGYRTGVYVICVRFDKALEPTIEAAKRLQDESSKLRASATSGATSEVKL